MRKPTFDDAVRVAHYAFLDALRARGLLEQAGPFTDRSGGAYVIRAANLAKARALAEQDPLYIGRCSDVTVYEWNADN